VAQFARQPGDARVAFAFAFAAQPTQQPCRILALAAFDQRDLTADRHQIAIDHERARQRGFHRRRHAHHRVAALARGDGKARAVDPGDHRAPPQHRGHRLLDPPRDRAQQPVARLSTIGRIHHVEPRQRHLRHAQRRAGAQRMIDPLPRAPFVAHRRHRIAQHRAHVGRIAQRFDQRVQSARLRVALQMLHQPPQRSLLVRQRGARRAPRQPPHRRQHPPPVPARQQAQQRARRHAVARFDQRRQRRGKLYGAARRIVPPAQHSRPAPRTLARVPRHRLGKAQRLHEHRFADRADQEMRRPGFAHRVQPVGIAARQARDRRDRPVRRAGQDAQRRQPVLDCAARIDHRDRRAARPEPPVDRLAAPRRRHLPSAPRRKARQFVALPERQHEQDRPVDDHGFVLAHADVPTPSLARPPRASRQRSRRQWLSRQWPPTRTLCRSESPLSC
jgi:hypothetical protein